MVVAAAELVADIVSSLWDGAVCLWYCMCCCCNCRVAIAKEMRGGVREVGGRKIYKGVVEQVLPDAHKAASLLFHMAGASQQEYVIVMIER